MSNFKSTRHSVASFYSTPATVGSEDVFTPKVKNDLDLFHVIAIGRNKEVLW